MLKPMMGPLSDFGPGCSGIAVWTPPPLGGGEEWMGILVWIEAGSECSGVDVDMDVGVCVGFSDEDNEDDDGSCCRFIKRWRWSWEAA